MKVQHFVWSLNQMLHPLGESPLCLHANIHTALNWAFDPDGAINKHIQGLYKRFIDTGCINKLFSENDGWKVRSQHI